MNEDLELKIELEDDNEKRFQLFQTYLVSLKNNNETKIFLESLVINDDNDRIRKIAYKNLVFLNKTPKQLTAYYIKQNTRLIVCEYLRMLEKNAFMYLKINGELTEIFVSKHIYNYIKRTESCVAIEIVKTPRIFNQTISNNLNKLAFLKKKYNKKQILEKSEPLSSNFSILNIEKEVKENIALSKKYIVRDNKTGRKTRCPSFSPNPTELIKFNNRLYLI